MRRSFRIGMGFAWLNREGEMEELWERQIWRRTQAMASAKVGWALGYQLAWGIGWL